MAPRPELSDTAPRKSQPVLYEEVEAREHSDEEEEVAYQGVQDSAPEVVKEHDGRRASQDTWTLEALSMTTVPDGGWGWAVLLGAVVGNILVIGHAKTFGMYIHPLMNMFNATPSRVAWIQSLQFFFFLGFAPVSSMLAEKFSPRAVTIAGGFLACIGMALSSAATSLEYLYLSYGILLGLSAVFTFTPGVMMIAQYFDKRRGLANGLGMAGNSLGGIFLPLLADKLISEYSIRGGMLIMGGVLLNSAVGAMLWQPVQLHQKKVKIPHENNNLPTMTSAVPVEDQGETPAIIDDGPIASELVPLEKKPYSSNEDFSNSKRPRRQSRVMMLMYNRKLSSYSDTEEGAASDTNLKFQQPLTVLESVQSAEDVSSIESIPKRTISSASLTSSFVYLSTFHLGPSLGALPKEPDVEELSEHSSTLDEIIIAEIPIVKIKKMSVAKPQKRRLLPCLHNKKYFDFSFFQNSVFYVMMIPLLFHNIGYPGTQMYLPLYATTLGYSNRQAAVLLSVLAFTDVIGRIGCAWLSDLQFCRRKHFYITGMFLSGLFAYLLPFASDYNSLLVCAGGFGLASGAYIGLTVALFADAFGTEKVAKAHSLATMCTGLAGLGGGPVIGYILETTGSYILCQAILGTAQIMGSLVYLLEPWAVRREAKKGRYGDKAKEENMIV